MLQEPAVAAGSCQPRPLVMSDSGTESRRCRWFQGFGLVGAFGSGRIPKKGPPWGGPLTHDQPPRRGSGHRDAVIVVHGAGACRVVPVPGIVVAVFRRALELGF